MLSRAKLRTVLPTLARVPLVFRPQVMMTVDGVLTDVLDLTASAIQRALSTTHQELTGDMTRKRVSPSSPIS